MARLFLLGISSLIAAALSAQAGAPQGLDALLGQPPSAGRLALLHDHLGEPRAIEKVKAGLGDRLATTRAAAARLVLVGGLVALHGEVRAALDAESDIEAAREELRALVATAPELDPASVFTAARRFEGALDAEAAGLVLRRLHPHGDALLTSPDFAALALTPGQRVSVLDILARGDLVSAMALGERFIETADARGWRQLLRVRRQHRLPIDGRVVERSLGSASSAIRSTSAWVVLLQLLSQPDSIAAELRETLAGAAPDAEAELDPDERFVWQLLERFAGGDKVEDPAWIARVGEPVPIFLDAVSQEGKDRFLKLLAGRERRAIEDRRIARPPWAPPPEGESLRTISGFPSEMIWQLLQETGCQTAKESGLAVAAVRYGRDGAPVAVDVTREPREAGCRAFARAVFATQLADLDAPPERLPETLVLPFHNRFLRCLDDTARVESLGAETGIQPPTPTHQVTPRYGKLAREQGDRGIVVLNAVIAKSGCVRDVSLASDSPPTLAVAAIEAAVQWSFEPARRDGQPVAVSFVLTTNFK